MQASIRKEMNPGVDERFDRPEPLNLSADLANDGPWPTCWLEDLLSVVHYNFQFGRIFYCVSCSKSLYQDKDFAEGAHHSGHRRLKMYNYQGAICVNRADIESHGVSTTEIQKFLYESSFFIFLHNTFGYDYEVLSNAKPGESCDHCHTKLDYVSGYYEIRFCSMQCKFRGMVSCKQDSLSTKLNIPVRRTPPPCDLPRPGVTYAQVTSQGTNHYRKSPGRILTEGKASGCHGHNVASSHEMSDSSDRSGADVHEHSGQQVPDVREADQISLPKALFEELEVRSFSPCEEILSMNVTAEHRSSVSSPESIYSAGLSSYADSKLVKIQSSAQTLLIPNPPESMVPTTPLFRTALAAASDSSSIVDEWRLHKTTDFMKSDWDVEGEGTAQVAGLGIIPKALDDNVLRKAAHLFRIFVSEFENNHSIGDEDDTNSKEGSASSEGTGSDVSIASPELESFNAEGLENRSHFAVQSSSC